MPAVDPAVEAMLEFAERPRTQDWSLRAALVRYAQAQPVRTESILDLVRRVEWALNKKPDEGVLAVAHTLDGLGDVLAEWAVEGVLPGPDDEVDRVVADVAARLEALGVPKQERPPGPRNRG